MSNTIKPFTPTPVTKFRPKAAVKKSGPEVQKNSNSQGPAESVSVDFAKGAEPPKNKTESPVAQAPVKELATQATEKQPTAPTVLVQEQGAPTSGVSDTGPVTETQLVTQAVESYGKADNHFNALNETFEVMSPDQQKEVGKATFYAVASYTGEMKKADGQPMTSGEIRQEVAGWKESGDTERVKAFESKVGAFMQERPEMVMLGQASGAAEWGSDRWETLQNQEASGKAVEPKEKEIAASAYLNGMGYTQESGKFSGAVNELVARGHQEMAQAVVDATVNA